MPSLPDVAWGLNAPQHVGLSREGTCMQGCWSEGEGGNTFLHHCHFNFQNFLWVLVSGEWSQLNSNLESLGSISFQWRSFSEWHELSGGRLNRQEQQQVFSNWITSMLHILVRCHWNAINFSEVNTLKLEKTLISTFAIKFGNTSEHIFPWLPKGHCTRIQKYSQSVSFCLEKMGSHLVDTLSGIFLRSTPLQSANIHPSTFKQRKDPADENNCFLLVLLHTKHTCRAAWEARKDITDCYCDIQVILYRSFYFTYRALHRVKWLELCSCHYSYSYQRRARACLPSFDFQTSRGLESMSSLAPVVKHISQSMSGDLVSCKAWSCALSRVPSSPAHILAFSPCWWEQSHLSDCPASTFDFLNCQHPFSDSSASSNLCTNCCHATAVQCFSRRWVMHVGLPVLTYPAALPSCLITSCSLWTLYTCHKLVFFNSTHFGDRSDAKPVGTLLVIQPLGKAKLI